jgi:hypothetical protein
MTRTRTHGTPTWRRSTSPNPRGPRCAFLVCKTLCGLAERGLAERGGRVFWYYTWPDRGGVRCFQFEWAKLDELAGPGLQAEGERRIEQAKVELVAQAKRDQLAAEQAERERLAAAAAEQERQRGLADEALQPESRLWLKEEGEGTYERWARSRVGMLLLRYRQSRPLLVVD